MTPAPISFENREWPDDRAAKARAVKAYTIKQKTSICFGGEQEQGGTRAAQPTYEQKGTRKEDKQSRGAYERREVGTARAAPLAKEVRPGVGGQARGCRTADGGRAASA